MKYIQYASILSTIQYLEESLPCLNAFKLKVINLAQQLVIQVRNSTGYPYSQIEYDNFCNPSSTHQHKKLKQFTGLVHVLNFDKSAH